MLTSFKKPDTYTAVVFEHTRVTAVELAHGPKGYTLAAAGSYETQTDLADRGTELSERGLRQREKAFAGELGSFLKRIGAAARRISFGLNTSMLMLQTVPMDASLDERGQMAQALWELKHFDSEATDTSHVLITQRLAPDPAFQAGGSGTVQTVIVGVRRSLVQFLTTTAQHLSASFNILDVQQFCAENAFNVNHPDAREKRTLLVGLDGHALTASTICEGQTVDVQVRSFNGDDAREFYGCVRESGAEHIYLHGAGASARLCTVIKQSLGVPADLIDPFRVVTMPGSLKGVAEIKGRHHEFTAAVGLAMRTE